MLDAKMPAHIAIIMDGNNRWAKQNNTTTEFAYNRGAEAAEKIILQCSELGIKYLTLYTFSSENWHRPENEVKLIMSTFKGTMLKQLNNIIDKNIRIIFIGDRLKMPSEVLIVMDKIEKLSENNSGFVLVIAVSYGSRNEIVEAAFYAGKHSESEDFDSYAKNFEIQINPHSLPDPDLLIRTSGEMRLSNFLLWQMAYTELYFTSITWPDFNTNHLHDALNEFKMRKRRFGKR